MVAVLLAVLVVRVWAGPDIIENATGDAGSLPASAKSLFGNGPLNSITGQLGGLLFTGPGDFEDMYLFRIADPSGFTATTTDALTDFNTQLWLFQVSGLGLLGNDNIPISGTTSILRRVATDGSGASVTTPGLYYLAVTGFNNDPLSIGGLPMFSQDLLTEVSGPDGAGGSMPVASWTGGGATGNYKINLTGCEFIPAPVPAASTLLLVLLAGALLVAAAIIVSRRGAPSGAPRATGC